MSVIARHKGRPGFRILSCAAWLTLTVTAAQPAARAADPPPVALRLADTRDTVETAFERARSLVNADRADEAVPLLLDLLTVSGGGLPQRRDGVYLPTAAVVRPWLRRLSESGWRRFDALASAACEAAAEKDAAETDEEGRLFVCATRYFESATGGRAAFALAGRCLDQRRWFSARAWLERLRDEHPRLPVARNEVLARLDAALRLGSTRARAPEPVPPDPFSGPGPGYRVWDETWRRRTAGDVVARALGVDAPDYHYITPMFARGPHKLTPFLPPLLPVRIPAGLLVRALEGLECLDPRTGNVRWQVNDEALSSARAARMDAQQWQVAARDPVPRSVSYDGLNVYWIHDDPAVTVNASPAERRGNTLSALDPLTGKRRWSIDRIETRTRRGNGLIRFLAAPRPWDNRLLVPAAADAEHVLFLVDPADGRIDAGMLTGYFHASRRSAWQVSAAMTCDGPDVYYAAGAGALVAARPSTEQVRWVSRYNSTDRERGRMMVTSWRENRLFIRNGKLVLLPADEHTVLVFDKAGGSLVARHTVEAPHLGLFLMDDGGLVFLERHAVACLDVDSGALRWRVPTQVSGRPLRIGPTLYVPALREILAVDLRHGREKQRVRVDDFGGLRLGNLLLDGDRLISAHLERVHALRSAAARLADQPAASGDADVCARERVQRAELHMKCGRWGRALREATAAEPAEDEALAARARDVLLEAGLSAAREKGFRHGILADTGRTLTLDEDARARWDLALAEHAAGTERWSQAAERLLDAVLAPCSSLTAAGEGEPRRLLLSLQAAETAAQWRRASPSGFGPAFDAALRARCADLADNPDPAPWLALARAFGKEPLGLKAAIEGADRAMRRGDRLLAESVWLDMAATLNPDAAAHAWQRLGALYAAQSRTAARDAALQCARDIEQATGDERAAACADVWHRLEAPQGAQPDRLPALPWRVRWRGPARGVSLVSLAGSLPADDPWDRFFEADSRGRRLVCRRWTDRGEVWALPKTFKRYGNSVAEHYPLRPRHLTAALARIGRIGVLNTGGRMLAVELDTGRERWSLDHHAAYPGYVLRSVDVRQRLLIEGWVARDAGARHGTLVIARRTGDGAPVWQRVTTATRANITCRGAYVYLYEHSQAPLRRLLRRTGREVDARQLDPQDVLVSSHGRGLVFNPHKMQGGPSFLIPWDMGEPQPYHVPLPHRSSEFMWLDKPRLAELGYDEVLARHLTREGWRKRFPLRETDPEPPDAVNRLNLKLATALDPDAAKEVMARVITDAAERLAAGNRLRNAGADDHLLIPGPCIMPDGVTVVPLVRTRGPTPDLVVSLHRLPGGAEIGRCSIPRSPAPNPRKRKHQAPPFDATLLAHGTHVLLYADSRLYCLTGAGTPAAPGKDTP